jgi:hypothetical protein
MARKTLKVVISADKSRDKGKTFIITEMSATQGEKWALRAFLALMKAGIQVPEDISKLGFAGLAVWGIQSVAGLEWEVAEPLLDEMWDCITIMPAPDKPEVTRRLIEDDIEEIGTRMQLRKETIALHTDFFTAAAQSTPNSTPTIKGG